MAKIGEDSNDLGIKAGVKCSVVKVFVKDGKKSGVPLGERIMTLGQKPSTGKPLYGAYESEHHMSGDPKFVKFPASSTIQKVRKISGVGLSIETETSILFITKVN